jgi:hypothetical protein
MVFNNKDQWSRYTIIRGLNMAKTDKKKITIDNVEYIIDELSDDAKTQIANINFVDSRIQQLDSEWAVSDTARIGYTNALKAELTKKELNK